jgi:hypothetical protein
MEIGKALAVMNELIRQSMANGLFKTLPDLDTAREALTSIHEHLKYKDNGKSKEGPTAEKNETGESGQQ